MAVNWNALQAPDIGGAFSAGLEMGRARRREKQQQDALAAYATNPDSPDAFGMMAQVNPQFAMKIRQDQESRRREIEKQDMLIRAGRGDTAALEQVLGQDPELWLKLDKGQRDKIKQSTEFLANAGMQISRIPEAQREQVWAQYVAQAEASGMDIPAHYERYSPQALNSSMAEAGMMQKFIDMNEPKVMPVAPGGTVYEYTPGGGGAGVGNGGVVATAPGNAPQVGTVEDGHRFLGGNPADPKSWEKVGGQTPAASGNFRVVGVPGERITSGYRTPAHNAQVGGVANSYHTRRGLDGKPLARDSVPPPGMSMATYAALIRKQNPHLDVINEGDHVHTEPKG